MSKRVIVDENVGQNTQIWSLFQQAFRGLSWEYLFLGQMHPGIPDVEILDKLIEEDSVLLTGDCSLHNRALAEGVRSYTLDAKGNLTGDRLPGIHLTERRPHSVYANLQSDYRHQSDSDIAYRLKAGLTERQIKQYRTVRRRIRSYFGAGAAISEASMTIGSRQTNRGLLSGFYLRLAGNSDVKGLQATEGYCFGSDKEIDDACPILFALRELYLLQLEQVRINLFIISSTSLALCREVFASSEQSENQLRLALHRLLHGLRQPSFHECAKGRFNELMQRKLENLATGRSNEIVTLDFLQLAAKLEEPVVL